MLKTLMNRPLSAKLCIKQYTAQICQYNITLSKQNVKILDTQWAESEGIYKAKKKKFKSQKVVLLSFMLTCIA